MTSLRIDGMTCASCAEHVSQPIALLGKARQQLGGDALPASSGQPLHVAIIGSGGAAMAAARSLYPILMRLRDQGLRAS